MFENSATLLRPKLVNPHNTFGKGHRARAVNGGLDEYYTAPAIAQSCFDHLKSHLRKWGLIRSTYIEPAAGNGVWLNVLPASATVLAYDINPKDPRIKKASFYLIKVQANSIVIGNPPFGFAAKEAVSFFNHAATGAAVIAFILPRTFRKPSIHNRLNPYYKLKSDIELPPYSFTVEGVPHDVPCCFQVWKRMASKVKQEPESIENPWLEFVTPSKADFAIRRVGGRSGQILEGLDHSRSSTYFIRSKIDRDTLLKTLQSINFPHINNTSGVRSLSKRELVSALRKEMSK